MTTITPTRARWRAQRAGGLTWGGARNVLGPVGIGAVTVLAIAVLVATFGTLLIQQDPNAVNLAQAYAAPSLEHWLGQDANGRDIATRLVVGARTAIVGPFFVIAISTICGIAIALTSVWVGGWFDVAVSRVLDAMFAFPGMLLAILAAALFGAGLGAAVIALSIAYIPYIARIVRSAALRERNLPYIAALQVQGVGPITIATRHIVPNISTLIWANAATAFGSAFIDLAGLSFIGLGVQAPTADWGAMVGNGVAGILQGYTEESVFAAICIVAVVGAVNVLGDRLGNTLGGMR